MHPKNKPLSPVGVLMREVADGHPEAALRDAWRRAAGERIAQRSQPTSLRDGVLRVRVATPVWAQELSLLERSLRARLVEHGVRARSLRFFVGKLEQRQVAPTTAKTVPPAVSKAELPAALKDRLAAVDDPELRAAIAEAAGWWHGRRESK